MPKFSKKRYCSRERTNKDGKICTPVQCISRNDHQPLDDTLPHAPGEPGGNRESNVVP